MSGNDDVIMEAAAFLLAEPTEVEMKKFLDQSSNGN
jgi:hypothetical protein